jgi:hypothetical protein
VSEAMHKAPPGKFIVGEALYGENEWAQVGPEHDSLKVALQVARELRQPNKAELGYFVYDEHGLVSEKETAS